MGSTDEPFGEAFWARSYPRNTNYGGNLQVHMTTEGTWMNYLNITTASWEAAYIVCEWDRKKKKD